MPRQLDVPGGRLAVYDRGDPDRRRHVPVLLHGLGYTADVWEPVARILAGHTRVVSFDLRGHGHSTARSTGPDDVWRDVRRVVDALELTDPVLVGHDFGAHAAVAAQACEPGLAAGILALDWVTPLPPAAARDWLAEVTGDDFLDELARRFDLGVHGPDAATREAFLTEMVERVGQDWMTSETGRAHARTGLERSVAVAPDGSWVRQPTPTEVATQVRIPRDSPAFPDARLYDRVRCPLWLALCQDGPYMDLVPAAQRLADRPERRFTLLPAGHHVEQTHPDDVARLVRRLLDDVAARDPA